MSYTVETIERDGCVGRISTDDYPETPREEGSYQVSVLTQLSDRFDQPDGGYDDRIRTAWQDGTRYHDTEKVERHARVTPDGQHREQTGLTSRRKVERAVFFVLLDNGATRDPREATAVARRVGAAPLGTPITAHGYTFTLEEER